MRLWRFLHRPRVRRFLLGSALLALASFGVGAVVGLAVARQAERDFRPLSEPAPLDLQAQIAQIPHYRRAEETTYLSFPEWYLVFNPQEYAQFLRTRPASGFAYGKSIGQFWRGYAQVYGITRHNYPFNFGNHLMLFVIGTSTTVEYVIKGAYENTVGRIFEWTSFGGRTAEEDYAATVAQEYGEFIPTQPWYDFPFGKKFTGLWTTTSFGGPHFLRKVERKFFLSLEYGVKFIYGGLIRLATHSIYGVADTEVYASVTQVPDRVFENPNVKKVRQLGPESWIVTLPHYQGFTDTAPPLAQQGVNFIEIAGNDEILATLIAPAAWTYDLSAGHPLFTMDLLNGHGLKRVAIQVPVRALGQVLREAATKGLRVEHLFDY